MRRARIGVTGPDRGGGVAWRLAAYAIRRAGGEALRISPSRPRPVWSLDGLVLGGGADIDPALYGEEVTAVREVYEASKKHVRRGAPWMSLLLAPTIFLARKVFEAHTSISVDQDRDELERALLVDAIEHNLPVLGICRGAQLMNVVGGGTLHQDVTELYVETPQVRTVLPRKMVTIAPKSHLATLLGTLECTVNALHHQSIADVAEGYEVVAAESNGVVQAIEDTRHPFRIGVQWHPEYLPQDRRQRALFQALVRAAETVATGPDARPTIEPAAPIAARAGA